MKKEVVVASAIVALLTSLSADNSNIRVNEIKSGVDGKIIAPKDIKDRIDGNKRIGKGDDSKFNLVCGWSCAKPGQADRTPILDAKPNVRERPNIGKAPKDIGQRP
jgi:hypothetical protein